MPKIAHPEAIFDRAALLREIEARLEEESGPPSPARLREAALEAVASAHARGREEIHRRFDAHGTGSRAALETSWLLDEIVRLLFALAKARLPGPPAAGGVCVAATGGYGRRALFPHSDIDILFLHAPESREKAEAIAGFLLYILWDLQLSVGQALHTADSAVAQALRDIPTRTSLLDARHICGGKPLFTEFAARFRREAVEGRALEFIRAKLEEREARHRRWGDSRYVLEPNVKEGKGGLRDLHTLYWIARYNYGIARLSELAERGVLTRAELRAFRKASEFFSVVRFHLHRLTGRAEERLTFDMQRAIAGLMGYRGRGSNQAVERFMKRYFLMAKEVGNLTRTVCAVLEAEKKKPRRGFLRGLFAGPRRLDAFLLEGGRLDFPEGYPLRDDPRMMLRLFHAAQRHGLDIHPRAFQNVSRHLDAVDRDLRADPDANALFAEILLARERTAETLRRMSDAGLLGKFIPDFGRVAGQMQFDMYHVYSVDEHILTAIGILQEIEQGKLADELPLATEIAGRVARRRALYLALLCHDIAKGRGGNHAEKGARVAQKLAERLGFSPEERQLAGWLAERHQLLSETAFKRDLRDPDTIRRLAEELQTPERLRLLLLITVADIRAVGPGIWNGWKGALLRDLCRRVEAQMGAREPEEAGRAREEAGRALRAAPRGWTAEAAENYLALGAPAFWNMLEPEAHARIAPAVMALEKSAAAADYQLFHEEDGFRSITELLLILHDRRGLFSLMSGVLAVCGANIQHAKIFTLKNGVAVERFGLQDWQGRAFGMREKEEALRRAIAAALAGELDLEAELARVRRSYSSRRLAPFAFAPSVAVNNDISAAHTVIEVTAMDAIGLLHDIARVLNGQGLSISTAHISTCGEQAVDVFYVKDLYGLKVLHQEKIEGIRSSLLRALAPRAIVDAP